MRPLTAKQQKFVDNIILGMTQADAYRNAGYSIDNMDNLRIAKKASELAAKGDIKGIIDQRKRELADRAIWDREEALGMLKNLAMQAMDNVVVEGEDKSYYSAANANTAIKAIEQANKMCGYNEPERHEVDAAITIQLGEVEELAK